jgi:hypothetical protein
VVAPPPEHAVLRGEIITVARAWLPLAASWLLMGCEMPAVSAVVARLLNPEIELAAFGSVIFPLALVIEAPIIMLLAASTTLSRDRASYLELRSFTHRSALILMALHVLITLGPIYDFVVTTLLGAPWEVAEASRTGLLIMAPWSWAIAYRRFNQGVLIRFGHSDAVTVGTSLRLGTLLAVLGLGWNVGTLPGAILASIAVVAGVTAEAIYSGLRVRSVVREHLQVDDPQHTPLRGRAFAEFYVPLALTPIITLIAQPLASAAVARMPETLPSLAVLPVVVGLLFMFQAAGLALTEVVVAGLERGRGPALWRFTFMLTVGVAALISLMAVTPLARVWFGGVSGLTPELVELARVSLLLGVPIVIARVLQSWYSGVLVHARRTRAISEAVLVFLLAAGAVLALGVVTQHWTGVYVAIAAYSAGRVVQTTWLWWRCRAFGVL